MSKGYILVDEPKSCRDCRFCSEVLEGVDSCCELEDDLEDNESLREIDVDYTQMKPDWCPIRELPKKMEVCGRYPQPGEPVPSYRIGWNKCIEQMEVE